MAGSSSSMMSSSLMASSSAVAVTRKIHLTWTISHAVVNSIDGVRIHIEADEAEGMDKKIFAYQQLPTNNMTGEMAGFFDHVCSPPDLADFPEDEPRPDIRPQWFRLNYVDVMLRSIHEAEDFLASVRSDVRILKHTLDIMDTLLPAGEEWIDAP